jgi:hypothetical protein
MASSAPDPTGVLLTPLALPLRWVSVEPHSLPCEPCGAVGLVACEGGLRLGLRCVLCV